MNPKNASALFLAAAVLMGTACMDGNIDDSDAADVMLQISERVIIPPVSATADTSGNCLYTVTEATAQLRNIAKSDIVGDTALQAIQVESVVISFDPVFDPSDRRVPIGVTIDPGTTKSVGFYPYDLATISPDPAGEVVDVYLRFEGRTLGDDPVVATGGTSGVFNACIGGGGGGDADGDGIPEDDGDTVADPCTGGNNIACDDNCPGDSNPTQADGDGDGIGDACDPS
jgi:hypothetical protein